MTVESTATVWSTITSTFTGSLEQTMLTMHDHLGLPWYLSIAATALTLRFAALPLKLVHHTNTLRMTAAQSEFTQRIQPLILRQYTPPKPVAPDVAASMKRKCDFKMREELSKLFMARGVSLGKMVLPIIVNVPLFIGMTTMLRQTSLFTADSVFPFALGEADWRMALVTVAFNAVVLRLSQHLIVPPAQPGQATQPTALQKALPAVLHVINLASYFVLNQMPVVLLRKLLPNPFLSALIGSSWCRTDGRLWKVWHCGRGGPRGYSGLAASPFPTKTC